MPSIAIVGMACRYPDARSPSELWENVLAQRRAFRRMPAERMRLDDYLSDDRAAPDRTYSAQAAVIDGYEFDRVRFRVAGSTFRSTDMAHWLALDVAAQALADAGFAEAEGLPRESTGVLLANTLTGDGSRANIMRLRWPYVRRVVAGALQDEAMSDAQRERFMRALETRYKAPFPAIDEDSLAGGLSNTIAGRICNYFNLKGGGYTVDGACASSLLAISNACSALCAGDLDVALAGGVDLSLDPFELVGFAKAGALACDEMRVYDVRSCGFLPGEGCGFVVLMRLEDALRDERPVLAIIRGWGISSDGAGGMTRPEREGQMLALRRAYARAGFGIETVGYFEGHGTGTPVGDATELEVLSNARRAAAASSGSPSFTPAAIGSIKANIGHTKAAAGLAGFIKATQALRTGILPPTTGCSEPHPLLKGNAALRVLSSGETWPGRDPARAAVSSMGFGGINAHVVLEAAAGCSSGKKTLAAKPFSGAAQDAEIFLFRAADFAAIRGIVDHIHAYAARLSRAELTDLAAELQKSLGDGGVRAAIVAGTPAELSQTLATLKSWMDNLDQHTAGAVSRLDDRIGVFLAWNTANPRIGFLFPGQGSPSHVSGGMWAERFDAVAALYGGAGLPTDGDDVATDVAQPAIMTACLAGLRVLKCLGIDAALAVGHSVGELAALHWAGALGEEAVLRVARIRGRAMMDVAGPAGAMAALGASPSALKSILNGDSVAVAGLNTPTMTVISGEERAVQRVLERASGLGIRATKLRVSHAFHSPLVAAAAGPLGVQLASEDLKPLHGAVLSTVTGSRLDAKTDLRALLLQQVTSPVRFVEAIENAAAEVDLLIEVGPGQVLGGLVRDFIRLPAVSLDAGGGSLRGLLNAAGAAFVLGAPMRHEALFAGRFTRRFDLNWRPRFFASPCETAPVDAVSESWPIPATPASGAVVENLRGPSQNGNQDTASRDDRASCDGERSSTFDVVRELVAERAELPVEAVNAEHRLLGDLHLNSIAVGLLVVAAARRLGLPAPASPTEYATATVASLAHALEDLRGVGGSHAEARRQDIPTGVDSWVRAFTVELVERSITRARPPLAIRQSAAAANWRVFAAPGNQFAARLGRELETVAGGGVAVCLTDDEKQDGVASLLQGAKAALANDSGRFLLVQPAGGRNAASSFARTLHLEAPQIACCVVTVPVEHVDAARWVASEADTASGFAEARYNSNGRRFEPVLRHVAFEALPASPALTHEDVLLVTGGGKGIAAECALALARKSGCRLLLLGRSSPQSDAELASNIERMKAAGVALHYCAADVTDSAAVNAAVREGQARFGPVTAFLHGAGTNSPQLIAALDEAAFHNTLNTKLQGARNVLAALDPQRLRLFVSFGSLIARTGMRGEADYAVANERLAELTQQWQAGHAQCRCVALEWTVWSGVGMGERLGRIDALVAQGITPISPDQGIRMLLELLERPLPSTRVVVSSRFGAPGTLRMETPELPFRRFLEKARVHYPDVELVVDADLTGPADPYLDDHVLRGERLLPAVMGLEAMAQVAMALSGGDVPPVFESIELQRPVIAPQNAALTIRIAALVVAPGRIEVSLRCDQTRFGADHFRATCVFGTARAKVPEHALDSGTLARMLTENPSPLGLEPRNDLYGRLLFQSGRFQRLAGYRVLRARECLAEIAPSAADSWFGRHLPADVVLGDLGAMDVSMHAIQACIPHATILPIGVDRLETSLTLGGVPRFVYARERTSDGDLYVYDVTVFTEDARPCARWEGLRLRAVDTAVGPGPWADLLLAPMIERHVAKLIPAAELSVSVGRNGLASRERSAAVLAAAMGGSAPIIRRPDGKPEAANGKCVSAAHCGDLVLAVAGTGTLACDMEAVVARPDSQWRDLLGTNRHELAILVAETARETSDMACSRIWTAIECLKKAGASHDAPLVMQSAGPVGWVTLGCGQWTIVTGVVERQSGGRLAVSILGAENIARL